MICQNCNEKEAVVRLTKIINGQAAEVHLCQECAQKIQGFGMGFYPGMVSNFLQALFGVNPGASPNQSLPEEEQIKCEGCGMTISQIQRAGKMGCSKCYEKFEPQMESLLRRIHGGVSHVGKVPVRSGAALKNKLELEKLKQKLKECINKEEFEQAAVIRDKIRDLEDNTGGGSNEA